MRPEDEVATRRATATVAAVVEGASTVVIRGTTSPTILSVVVSRMADAGRRAVLVAPPRRHLDSPALALIDCVIGLTELGLAGDTRKNWSSESASWWQRIDDVRRALKHAVAEGVVVVCDDPSEWAIPGADSLRHAEEVADVLLRDNDCTKVVLNGYPAMPPAVVIDAGQEECTRLLLAEGDAWGVLAGVVQRLRSTQIALAALSPAELRLLVAVAALAWDDTSVWVSRAPTLPSLADRLSAIVSNDLDLRRLWSAWVRASVPRRSLPDTWLVAMLQTVPDGVQRDILQLCLLEGSDRVSLVREARVAVWRQPAASFARRAQRDAARELLDHYVRSFEDDTEEQRPAALRHAGEALFAASVLGEIDIVGRVSAAFSDQLDALGNAAMEAGAWTTAQAAFELAIEFDQDDAFGRHYLAFALDADGVEPRRIEQEYLASLELDGRHPIWHARLISFLVVRARMVDARRQWQESLRHLTDQDGEGPLDLYVGLHLPVAANLLRRTELDFARDVLDDVPEWARAQALGYIALSRRLDILRRVLESGAFVPAQRVSADWWLSGPQLLGDRLPDGRTLNTWVAARVDDADDETVGLQVAIVEGSTAPVTGSARMPREDLLRFSDDTTRAAGVSIGDFVEIGYYGTDTNTDPVIRVLRPEPWEEGLQTPLNPARFLQRATWN